ncbi:uncharacterized protein LOC142974421 isoform X1 [Anticarsia gemmatalis]|uniref:uncharacterized protein LOC142974421 isoform X1 n=1 Tax=Anticarsia gemmatalis TaxID=129554 RepID=UPI003F76EC80
MRKTSQDGGDTTSITSGIENEIKKPCAIMKTKRSSIKRKVQSLSHESDDAVIEPLLQKDKEKPEVSNQSAKYNLLSKTKTDAISEKDNDKQKLLQDDTMSSQSEIRKISDTIITIPANSNVLPKGVSGHLHNHMNTNVFNSPDAIKVAVRSQILVEIDVSKQAGYNPSPLIFTTAKIHTDGKTKHMEPLQVTPVPILSTIEVSVLKGVGSGGGETSGIVTSSITTMHNIPKSKPHVVPEQDQKVKATEITTPTSKFVDSKSSSDKAFTSFGAPMKDVKNIDTGNKVSQKSIKDSFMDEEKNVNYGISGKTTVAQSPIGTSAEQQKTAVSNAFINKPDKIDAFKAPQQIDLNKNIKAVDKRDIKDPGTSEKKTEDPYKIKTGTNTSTGNKQLQRQKIAIDKDDSSKFKSNLGSPPLIDDLTTDKKMDVTAPSSKSVTQTEPTNVINSLSDKMKLPKSTANNVQSTSSITATSTTPPSISSTTVVANKSSTSNSITSVKPNTTSTSTILPISKTPVTKVMDSEVKYTGNGIKPSSVISTPTALSSAKTSSSKTPSASAKEFTPTTISQAVSGVKSDVPTAKVAVSKAKSQATDSKTEITASIVPITTQKSQTTSTNSVTSPLVSNTTAKGTPASKPLVKDTSGPVPAEKGKSATTPTSKGTSASIPTAKEATVSTPIPKGTTASTSIAKGISPSTPITKATTPTTSTGKSTSGSIPIAKGTASTPTVKSTIASVPISKGTTASTPTAKDTSASIPTAKGTATSIPISKSTTASTPAAKSTTASTAPAKSTSVSAPTTKETPVSTTTAKATSATTPTAKSTSVTIPTSKDSSASTQSAKVTAASTQSAKVTAAPTATTKSSSVSGTSTKGTTVSATSVKSPAISTTSAMGTTVVTTSAINAPTTTGITKNAPLTTSAAKIDTAKSNITTTSKTGAETSKILSTSTVSSTTNSTSSSNVLNKKSDAKSNELSNGNKSLKTKH